MHVYTCTFVYMRIRCTCTCILVYMYRYMYTYMCTLYMHVHVYKCLLYTLCVVCIPFQSALGWDTQSELATHGSQTDAKKGFGGRFGVQTDRQDQVEREREGERGEGGRERNNLVICVPHTVHVYMYMYMYHNVLCDFNFNVFTQYYGHQVYTL